MIPCMNQKNIRSLDVDLIFRVFSTGFVCFVQFQKEFLYEVSC